MIEFGKTLRDARENKGMTIGQVAEITRMAPTTIEELEAEDFSRIAAPIYGRGFVKLYCEAVGIDAKPLVAEFMEIYNGNRDVGIRERTVASDVQKETCAAQEPPEIIERPIEDQPDDLPKAEQPSFSFDAGMVSSSEHEVAVCAEPPLVETPILATESPAPIAEPEPIVAEETTIPQEPARESILAPKPIAKPKPFILPTPVDDEPSQPKVKLAKYAPPIRQRFEQSISPVIWRVGALAIAAVIILLAVFWSARALYRATTAPAVQTTEKTQTAEPVVAEKQPTPLLKQDAKAKATKVGKVESVKTEAKPAVPAEKRIPQKIPALYID